MQVSIINTHRKQWISSCWSATGAPFHVPDPDPVSQSGAAGCPGEVRRPTHQLGVSSRAENPAASSSLRTSPGEAKSWKKQGWPGSLASEGSPR